MQGSRSLSPRVRLVRRIESSTAPARVLLVIAFTAALAGLAFPADAAVPTSERDALIERLKERYVLVPVCPEQLGGMPTPRTSERLHGTGADVLDRGLRIIVPGSGEDVTQFHLDGAKYTLEIAEIVGARRAYLKGGSPSCDRDGVAGEVLSRGGVRVIRVP